MEAFLNNKYTVLSLKVIWFLFQVYVVLQMAVLIVAGFFIPELGGALIMTAVGLVLGFMMGYLKGYEKCKTL